MSLRWKGSIGRRFLKEDGGHATAADSNKPSSRRVELELGVKAISGLPVSQPSSPTGSGSDDSSGGEGSQTTLCVTWRKNGKLEHGEDKRRQREGTTLTAKVAPDGTCTWEGGRMTIVPCHIRKFDAKADVCDHKTVTFYVNQVVGSRTKKLKKMYEATLDLDRLTLYPTYSEEHLVLRPLGFRNKPSHDIAWLLIQVRVLNFKALPTPNIPAASSILGGSHEAYQVNPREMPIASRTQSIGSIEGELSLGKAARRLSQQLVRVRSMPGEEGKPKESQGEADGEEGKGGDDGDHAAGDDEAERKRREKEEAERYIQLYLDGYKEKKNLRQSQDRELEPRDAHHQQHDHQLAPRRSSSSSRRSSLEASYNEKIAHYEGVLQQMQETREQMHREIDELVRQLEETKLDAARLLRELELRDAPPAAQDNRSGGEEGPDEPLREETARMVEDLRALIIEREDQLAELRSELGRRTAEIDALMRERDDEAAAARDAARRCEELREALEANERERDEVQCTLDHVLGQASAMHEELLEKQARLAELEELALRSAHDAEAQLESERLREAVDELTRRLEAKRKRNAECKQHIAELEESMVEKQAELDIMTRNRNALYQRCEELEADRERMQLEQEAERAAKEAKRSQKAEAAAAAAATPTAAASEQEPLGLSSSQAKLAADRRLLHELGEAKKQLRQRRNEVAEFDQALAEMANASRASEAQVVAWEHQLLACRQRIAELGSPVAAADASNERGRLAISECEADIEVLQRQVMAELDGMREVAKRYEQVKQRRDEAARACDELAHAASSIKQRILTSRKRGKARRSTSMTGMTSRACSRGDAFAGQESSYDHAPALDKLVSLQWEVDTRALIERHVWSYDPAKRQPATARTAVKEILGQLQVFQPRNAGEAGPGTLTSLVHGLMRALARSHKRASGLEEQIHWLSFTCHLLHGLKSNPESAGFFHPAVYYSVPDPAESGVGVAKVKFRVQQPQPQPQEQQRDAELSEDSLVEHQPMQAQAQAQTHAAEDAPMPNYTSFLWLQKLHNLVLRIYRAIVALACASIEPVIAALMQPKQQLPPAVSSSSAQSPAPQPQLPAAAAPSTKSTGTGGGEGSEPSRQQAVVHHEAVTEAGLRMFARSTRETLRGLGFMKAKLPEAPLPAPDDDYETAKCVREFKGIIESLFELLIAEGVHEAVVIQLCKQLFHHLDVSLFNRLLTGNDLVRSPAHAVKIKYFLSQLVDWCLHDVAAGNTNDEQDGETITLAEVLQLSCTFLERHTAEATSLLVMDKERILEEGDNLRALFSHLNGHQIVHLLEKIHVDESAHTVASGQRLSATPRWMVLLSRLALATPHHAAAASTGDLPTAPPATTTSAAAPQASQGLSQPLQLPTSLLSFQSLPNL